MVVRDRHAVVLIDTLQSRGTSSFALEDMVGSGDLLSSFDVDDIATEALLFQTGYLTITGTEDLGGKTLYRWGIRTARCARA